MTIKQKKFVERYIETGNGVESARKAGYGKKKTDNYLARVASENVRKCSIKAEIDKRMVELEAKTDVTIKEVIENARYLIEMGKKHNRGNDIAAGNKQLGETIAAFTQNVNQSGAGLQLNIDLDKEDVKPAIKIA